MQEKVEDNGEQDAGQNGPVFSCGGQDDGHEHCIRRETERRDGGRRQEMGAQTAEDRSAEPTEERAGRQSQHIGKCKRLLLQEGDGDDFIGNTHCDEASFRKTGSRSDALRDCQCHQEVAHIERKAGQDNGKNTGVSVQLNEDGLTGSGEGDQSRKKQSPQGDILRHSGGRYCENDGKIAGEHRKGVDDSFAKQRW